MSQKKNSTIDMDWKPDKIQESNYVRDAKEARILLHKDKNQIVTLLIQKARTIQDLSKSTGINPGTIKRHLDDLIAHKFVYMSKQERSEYNVKMKFYSTIAQEFIIDIHIPEEHKGD